MAKKLTEKFVKDYLFKNGYELLSEYKNTRTKIKIKNIKTGDIYEQKFSNFRQGKMPVPKKLSQKDVSEYFYSHGYLLIDNYENANKKVKIKNTESGKEFYTTFGNFKSGHRPENKNNTKDKKKFYIDFKNRWGNNFIILNSNYKNNRSDVYARCSKCGTCYHKKAISWLGDSGCHLCSSNSSRFERIICTILKNSKYNFEYSKRERFNNHIREFDFWLPDINTYIEYDGRQHTNNKSAWYRGEKIDKEKDAWASHMNRKVIRIPYTEDNPQKIILFLIKNGLIVNKYDRSIIYDYNSNIERDITNYYLKHTMKETITQFNISESYVKKIIGLTLGCSKTKYLSSHTKN